MLPNAVVPRKGILLFIHCPGLWMQTLMVQLRPCSFSPYSTKQRVGATSLGRSAVGLGEVHVVCVADHMAAYIFQDLLLQREGCRLNPMPK